MTSASTRCTRWALYYLLSLEILFLILKVAQLTAGYSGSDLASLARDAAYGPIRELKMDEVKSLDPVELRKVDMNDFLDSMKRMKKSVSPDSLAPFETWNHKFGEGSG